MTSTGAGPDTQSQLGRESMVPDSQAPELAIKLLSPLEKETDLL